MTTILCFSLIIFPPPKFIDFVRTRISHTCLHLQNLIEVPAKFPVADVVEGRLACVNVTCCGEIALCRLNGFETGGEILNPGVVNSKILLLEQCVPPDILFQIGLRYRTENVIESENISEFGAAQHLQP